MLGLLSKKESKSILKTASADADTLSLAHEKTASFGLSDGESVTTSMLDDKEFEFDSEIINTAAYRKVFNKARSKLPPKKGSQVIAPTRPRAASGVGASETVRLPIIKTFQATHPVKASQKNEYLSPCLIASPQDIVLHSVLPQTSTEGAGDGTSGMREEQFGVVQEEEPESTSKKREYRTPESSIGTTIGTGWRDKVKLARTTDHCHQSAPAGQLLTPQGDDPQSSSNNNSQHAPISSDIEFIRRKPDVLGTKFPRNGLRRFTVLRALLHPNIVRFHDTFQNFSYPAAILNYASIPGENLAQYVAAHPRRTENFSQKFFAQIISAVGYLHRNGVVNPTLSCSEVFLDSNQNAVLTGFRNVKSFDTEHCPALFRGKFVQHICCSDAEASLPFYEGRKADVWGCGTILVSTQYELMTSDTDDLEHFMLTGDLAFAKGIVNSERDDAQLQLEHVFSLMGINHRYYSDHARHLLTRMFAQKIIDRAELPEVARHVWLSDYTNITSDIIKYPISSACLFTVAIS